MKVIKFATKLLVVEIDEIHSDGTPRRIHMYHAITKKGFMLHNRPSTLAGMLREVADFLDTQLSTEGLKQ